MNNMKIICDVAKETNSLLYDNFTRWERMRCKQPEIHRLLMEGGWTVRFGQGLTILYERQSKAYSGIQTMGMAHIWAVMIFS